MAQGQSTGLKILTRFRVEIWLRELAMHRLHAQSQLAAVRMASVDTLLQSAVLESAPPNAIPKQNVGNMEFRGNKTVL